MTAFSPDQDGSVFCRLSQFGLIQVSGSDAASFLQNLLSSDIRTLTPQHAQLSSLNTAKGRMLASFLIWHSDGDYFLQLPAALLAAIQKKLSLYVLRSQVNLSDASQSVVSFGIEGAAAVDALSAVLELPLPVQDWQVSQQAGLSVIRLGAQRFQLNAPAARSEALWAQLAAELQPVAADHWDWLTVRAGIPVILPATQEQFVPQMANLELIGGGVSFKKGCYPGQEIVARMQYLGKAKRRLYLAHVDPADGQAAPQAGDTLFSTRSEEQADGMIANVAAAPGGGYDLLGVIPIASREQGSLHLDSPQGTPLQFLPLPYAVP